MNVSLSRRLTVGLVSLAAVGAACGSDAGGVEAADAWSRPSPMMADAAAVYLTLSSDEEVTITSVAVDGDIAGRAELHETVAMDMTMDDESMDEDAMDEDAMDDESMEEDGHEGDMAMTMREVEGGLTVPAGGELVLEPGGLHVMLLDLPEPLEEGTTFEVTFTLDEGEELTVPVEVRTEAP